MTPDTCADCVFGLEIIPDVLFCRRFPPVSTGPDDGRNASWPKVARQDWCGEHSLDASKATEARLAGQG